MQKTIRCILLALSMSISAGGALAQAQPATPPGAYEPSVGQEGKDVVWVPTPQALVDKMLAMAKVTQGDYLIDLGSGDGRTVITAAKRGVRAMGIEYNPEMVELSKRNAQKESVGDKVTFVKADLFESDFSKATVITMFLLDRINLQLRPRLLDLKPGTRLVSNTFTMGEWNADEKVYANEKEGCANYCAAHLWIVPAKVAGTWRVSVDGAGDQEMTLRQGYNGFDGDTRQGERSIKLTETGVSGQDIRFVRNDGNGRQIFSGRVDGNRMEGTVELRGGKTASWRAVRQAS